MFGKFRRDDAQGGRGDRAGRRSPSDFGFPTQPSAQPKGPVVNYDRLGQTLVATPTIATLSGPDAAALASGLCEQIHDSHNGPEAQEKGGVRHVERDRAGGSNLRVVAHAP